MARTGDRAGQVTGRHCVLEQEYRLLIEGVISYAIVMLDPDGHVVLWNTGAEKLYGYRADEIIGRQFACFFLPEDIEDGRPRHELEVAAREGNYVQDGWRIRKDGSRFLSHASLTPLRNEFGDLRGFAKITHCPTEPRGFASEKDQK